MILRNFSIEFPAYFELYVYNWESYWQAVSLASANYIGEVFQGMMIGVTMGVAG